MRERRSVRRFKDTPVSAKIIHEILVSASLAPETDTCSFYFGVVRDLEVKKGIAQATLGAQWVADAPVIFVCCADISWDIADQHANSYGVVGSKLRFGDNLVKLLMEHENRQVCKTILQAPPVYIAAQHMILSAVSHRLRGCLVDFIDVRKINNILDLPSHITCQVLVPIGYPNEVPRQKEQYDLRERAFCDNWSNRFDL